MLLVLYCFIVVVVLVIVFNWFNEWFVLFVYLACFVDWFIS